MAPNERGSLDIEHAADGSTRGNFIPLESPDAGTAAASRLAARAKLIEIPSDFAHLSIYPMDTRPWRDEFLGPKYAQIVEIRLPMDLDSNSEIIDLLEDLPSGFTKDYEYGLGLARECDLLIQLIEDHTDCTVLDFTMSGEPRVVGVTFELSLSRFDALRSELGRIKARGDLGIRRVRETFLHNDLADRLGLEPRQLSLGRLPSSQWITRVASGETPLNEDEQSQLVTATLSSATLIAAEAPAKIAQLQREIEMVNLEQLIVRYAEALEAGHREDWWQEFFEKNVFALQLLFGGPTVFVNSQVPIGDGANSIKGKKIADYLLKNSMTNNASIVEIKKPSTKLLKKRPYREGVYGVQSEIGETVAQVLDQSLQLTRHEGATQQRIGDSSWVSNAPRCFIVAGRLSDLDSEDKRKSFDLYREHLAGVRIVAYDEIYEALVTLRDFMKPDPGPTS